MRAVQLVKQTFSDFSKDKCTQLAASLAYATVFALPPLLLLILAGVGRFVDPQDFRRIVSQVQQLVGSDGARMIGGIITQANRPGSGIMGGLGVIMLVVALIVLIGAEFTQVWARNHGRAIQPEVGAIRDEVAQVQRRRA